MFITRKYFNLIEIMMALGVVAIGICSIMVLFPIGATANADSIAQMEISQAVQQFISYKKYEMTIAKAADFWKVTNEKTAYETEGNAYYIPPEYPQDNIDQSNFDSSDLWEKVNFENGALRLLLFKSKNDANLFQLISVKYETYADEHAKVHPTKEELYNNVSVNDNENIHNTTLSKDGINKKGIIEQRIIFRVKREENFKIGSESIPSKIALRLMIEASWPAAVPNNNRQKDTYFIDIFNEN